LLLIRPYIASVWFEAAYQIQVPVEHWHPSGDRLEFRLFETESLLSDAGAQAFQGRCTRVWKVREVIDGEKSRPIIALKDRFVDVDRQRNTVNEIRGSLPEGSSPLPDSSCT